MYPLFYRRGELEVAGIRPHQKRKYGYLFVTQTGAQLPFVPYATVLVCFALRLSLLKILRTPS
jgi:hypothetical protein